MDLNLGGTSAVVVGGARGLGLAIAEGFSREGCGWRSWIWRRRTDRGWEDARDGLGGHSGRRDRPGIREESGNRGSTNAGGGATTWSSRRGWGSGQFGFPFWEVDVSHWGARVAGEPDRGGTVATLFLRGDGPGAVWNDPVRGVGGGSDRVANGSAVQRVEGGLDQLFSMSLAKDLAKFGVRVQLALSGDGEDGELNRSVYEAWAVRVPEAERPGYDAWADEKIRTLVLLGRWQSAEDIAWMAVFLASDRAGNVTGQTINVDGGYVMHW